MALLELSGAGVGPAGRAAAPVSRMRQSDRLLLERYPEIANGLWIDGKSFVGSSPLVGFDRAKGRPIDAPSAAQSPKIVPVSGWDGPGITLKNATHDRIYVPYEIPSSAGYFFIYCCTLTDGVTTAARGAFGHFDGDGLCVASWLSQAAPGGMFSVNLRHGTSGSTNLVGVATGASTITAGVRRIFWGGWTASSGRGYIGTGSGAQLAYGTIAGPKKSLGTRFGTTQSNANASMEGSLDFLIIGDAATYGGLWDLDAGNAVNARRLEIITFLASASMYNVAI